MTDPTITYGHKFLSDLTQATEVWEGNSWTWTECTLGVDLISILAGDITATYLHGDIMQIQLDCDNAATVESGFYSYPDKDGANNLGFSTTTYPKFLCRYKTSAASAGVAAKVVLAFNGYVVANSVDTNIAAGHAQEILTNSYSTTWATATGDITAGKTIDHILMFAECDATTPNATYYVYYDFALIHKGTFTFPYVPPGGVHYDIPYKTVELDVLGRDGGILQRLGMKSPLITVEGSMDVSATGSRWKIAPSTSSLAVRGLYGNRLYKITRGMEGDYREPWNWFTSDLVNCKVVPDVNPFRISTDSNAKEHRQYSMHFKQYSLSSLGEADWDELEWAL